jgi:hypothetical protein
MSGFRIRANVPGQIEKLNRTLWFGTDRVRRASYVSNSPWSDSTGMVHPSGAKKQPGWTDRPEDAKLYASAKNALRSIASGACSQHIGRAYPGPSVTRGSQVLHVAYAIEHVHPDGSVEEVPWPE